MECYLCEKKINFDEKFVEEFEENAHTQCSQLWSKHLDDDDIPEECISREDLQTLRYGYQKENLHKNDDRNIFSKIIDYLFGDNCYLCEQKIDGEYTTEFGRKTHPQCQSTWRRNLNKYPGKISS